VPDIGQDRDDKHFIFGASVLSSVLLIGFVGALFLKSNTRHQERVKCFPRHFYFFLESDFLEFDKVSVS
jgi:hypothetical protein